MTDDQTHADRRPPGFPTVGGTGPGDETSAHDLSPFLAPVAGRSPALLPASASPDGAVDVLVEPVGGARSRWRWVAALVATVAVIALVVGAFLLAGPRVGTPSLVSHYVAADTQAYMELRLDLPGDQRDRVVRFMSHFPGFADPSNFQQKLDETLQQALHTAGTDFNWTTDVEPWFGGQLAVAITTFPGAISSGSMTVVLSVKDRAKLDELVDARLTDMVVIREDYKGQQLVTVRSEASTGGILMTFAVTGEALVISDTPDGVKKALDVKAGEVPSLAADDSFLTQQLATFHADRLATFYYDYSPVIGAMPTRMPGLAAGCLDYMNDLGRIRYVGELRAEGDHLALNTRMQYPTGSNLPPVPANSRSALAEAAPADTVAYMEIHGLGGTIGWIVSQSLDCLDTSGLGFNAAQIQQMLGVEPQKLFDFVIDGAVVVTSQDGKFGGGLVATVDDENVARQRVERLLSAARILGAVGGGLTIEDQQHGDATVTIITPANQPENSLFHSLSVTVTGGKLYLGTGDFVARALDQSAADSLATQPRFRSSLEAGGLENAGISYFDIAALRGNIEGMAGVIPAADRAHYEAEVKPFLAPFDHLMIVGTNDVGFLVGHAFLYVE